jgi:hypothetical protein
MDAAAMPARQRSQIGQVYEPVVIVSEARPAIVSSLYEVNGHSWQDTPQRPGHVLTTPLRLRR